MISPHHKKVFDGIFRTLETGLSKLGDSSASQTKAISALLQLIKDIPMDGKQDYDVLGFIYEYLIGMFAANAGKKAGEFYTPHEVSLLMSEIVAHHVKDKKELQIYDPTSGSGSLLINIGRSVAKHMADENAIKYYAQELKQNTYNLTRMNLVMRGILVDNIVTRNGDTLEDDWPFFDESDPAGSYHPLYVDAVVSNPPYSQKWDPSHKEADARYARFGLAPKSKADYAFLLHDLFHLKPDGIMTIVLPHGVLFRGGDEGGIRKKLVEGNHIDAIIGLPSNIFFGTGIPTIIMVLRQKRAETSVLMVDASKGFEKAGKSNHLRASDIKRIVDTVVARKGTPRFSRVVERDEIRANEYNLNLPRYVDSSDPAESWDLYASMFGGIPQNEIGQLAEWWKAVPGLRETLFGSVATPYTSLNTTDLKAVVAQHPAVMAFVRHFQDQFQDLGPLLQQRLVEKAMKVSLSQEETILGHELFRRFESVPLVDPYAAYQILDDAWSKIAIDIEILQTEGFSAARMVDPHMVTKKKDGKEVEVQEGWLGRVLPFELVQGVHLPTQLKQLQATEKALSTIADKIEAAFESFDDEEKESASFNEDKDGFVPPELAKEAKQVRTDQKNGESFAEGSYEAKIVAADNFLKEEKALKKAKTEAEALLHLKTKAIIEGLSDDQVNHLLNLKWVEPLVRALHQLPRRQMDALSARVQGLSEKYATTYQSLVTQIHETEKSLSVLMDDLTGDDHCRQGLAEFQRLLKGE